MAAARTQTIVLAQPNRRSAGIRRARSSGPRRRNKRGGFSPARSREKYQTQTMVLGGVAALAFGLIQRKVKLPGIPGVPNSLTYGGGLAAIGVIAKSGKIVQIASGPLMAGLHNIGLRGLGADVVAGEFDSTEGEFDEAAGDEFDSTEGEFDEAAGDEQEEVSAGDFDDL